MVLILDGNSKYVAHAWRNIGLFGEKNPIHDCSRSNEMTQKDRIIEMFLTCAPIFEFQCNKSTMVLTQGKFNLILKIITILWGYTQFSKKNHAQG